MQRISSEDYMAQRPTKEFLAHYITFRPNVLANDTCDKLVKLYDDNSDLCVERSQGEGHFKFSQLDVTEHRQLDNFANLHKQIVSTAVNGLNQYIIDIEGRDSPNRIPVNNGYEHFRINRTNNNGKDGFGEHTDIGDYASARRYITALFYLNDIEVGGDAAFPPLGFSLKPTKGSMLCFPSNWVYLHCGLKPISDPKYIMTTFAHYL